MFFTAVIGEAAALRRAAKAAKWHGDQLAITGWAGTVKIESFAHSFVAWDADSTHADIARDERSLVVTAGYVAGGPVWVSGEYPPAITPTAEGEFASVQVSTGSDSVTLAAATDPAGSWPVYWGRTPDLIVASNDPHFVAIALGVTDIDQQAAYELAAYHHTLEHGSTFPGVRRLAPGQHMYAARDGSGPLIPTLQGSTPYRYQAANGSPDEVIERAWTGLQEGVRANPALQVHLTNATLQISGGLDSRLTLGVIADVFEARPRAVTLNLSDPVENDIAKSVSNRLGFPHELAQLESTDLATLRNGWLLTGGQVSPYAAAGNLLSYSTATRRDDGSILLVGGWPGDCLIGSYVPRRPGAAAPSMRAWFTADWRAKRAPRWSQRGIAFTGPDARRYQRRASATLRTQLREGSGCSAAQRISYWAMFSRQPAFSYISPAVLSSRVLAVTPLLSPRYLDHLMTLRGIDIYAKNFYRRLILRKLPTLADIPYAATGHPIVEDQLHPPRFPRSIDDAYTWLPAAVQNALYELIGRRRRQPTFMPSTDAETSHWCRVLDAAGVSGVIDLDGATIDARSSSDVHVRSIELALRWSREYLFEAKGAIDD